MRAPVSFDVSVMFEVLDRTFMGLSGFFRPEGTQVASTASLGIFLA
jgi:hypothetical protein